MATSACQANRSDGTDKHPNNQGQLTKVQASRILAAVATLTVAASLSLTSASLASAATGPTEQGSARLLGSLQADDFGQTTHEKSLDIRASANGTCVSTEPDSPLRQASVTQSCTREITGSETLGGNRSSGRSVTAAAATLCDQTTSGSGLVSRFGLCVKDKAFEYIVRNSSGTQVGRGVYTVTT